MKSHIFKKMIMLVLIISLVLCMTSCAKDSSSTAPPASDNSTAGGNTAAAESAPTDIADETLESDTETAPADTQDSAAGMILPSGAEIGEDGKYILRIYPSYVVVRTPEGDLVAKHYNDVLPGETLMETISEDEATLIFCDENGNPETFEPMIGMTGYTHTDIVSMPDSDFLLQPTAVKIAGFWVLQSTTDGRGDFDSVRIDPDGYVYAQMDGNAYDGLWWEDAGRSRIHFGLRNNSNEKQLFIYEFEVHQSSLTLRYIDNTNSTCGEEYVYSREPLDYTRFDAQPGCEQLPAADAAPYLQGVWYCDDPYLDTQRLPYKLIFTPAFESQGVVCYYLANINDQWVYAVPGEGKIIRNDITYNFEIIDQNTMRIWWKYFQGSFNEEDLGLAEAVYTKISYYANDTHNY